MAGNVTYLKDELSSRALFGFNLSVLNHVLSHLCLSERRITELIKEILQRRVRMDDEFLG